MRHARIVGTGSYLPEKVDRIAQALLSWLIFPLLLPLQWAIERARGWLALLPVRFDDRRFWGRAVLAGLLRADRARIPRRSASACGCS